MPKEAASTEMRFSASGWGDGYVWWAEEREGGQSLVCNVSLFVSLKEL
jgi:hypothetical protein